MRKATAKDEDDIYFETSGARKRCAAGPIKNLSGDAQLVMHAILVRGPANLETLATRTMLTIEQAHGAAQVLVRRNLLQRRADNPAAARRRRSDLARQAAAYEGYLHTPEAEAEWNRLAMAREAASVEPRDSDATRRASPALPPQGSSGHPSKPLAGQLAPRSRPTMDAQEQAIIDELVEMGHNPKALPRYANGSRSVKADVRDAIGSSPPFGSLNAFDVAWARLLKGPRLAWAKT